MTTEPYVFRDWRIRPDMVDALQRYVTKGYRPGSFLTAVLAHDLQEACMRADDDNLANIPAYAAYLYNEIPGNCHGSYTIVDRWVESGGGLNETTSTT
jgi:expansin (peptidoglycan-binding protein)